MRNRRWIKRVLILFFLRHLQPRIFWGLTNQGNRRPPRRAAPPVGVRVDRVVRGPLTQHGGPTRTTFVHPWRPRVAKPRTRFRSRSRSNSNEGRKRQDREFAEPSTVWTGYRASYSLPG